MSAEGKGKKRSKAFYRKSAHGGKRQRTDGNFLMPGIKGFLVMCNHNESQAVRECYNILNEYGDKLYGQGKSKIGEEVVSKIDRTNAADSHSEEEEEEDIEKALKKEVADMKTTKSEVRRFQNCCTKAKNCIFIRSTVEDPVQVCLSVMEDIAEKHLQRARYAARIVPVIGTCKAHTDDITKMGKECLPNYFSPDSKILFSSYTVIFKTRNNNNSTCNKTVVIPELTSVVKAINSQVQFTWSDFDVAILVDVVCNVCCISFAPGFHRLRKYNLQELQQGPRTDSVQEKGDTEQGAKVDSTEAKDDSTTPHEDKSQVTDDEHSKVVNSVQTYTITDVKSVTAPDNSLNQEKSEDIALNNDCSKDMKVEKENDISLKLKKPGDCSVDIDSNTDISKDNNVDDKSVQNGV